MRSIANWILGYDRELYKFELELLEAIRIRLSPDSQATFQAQIDSINRVYRLTKGREVNLYAMKFGRVQFDDKLRFVGTRNEVLLANAILTGSKNGKSMKTEFWLVEGRLFSIVFEKSPQEFFGTRDLREVYARISNVRILLDPSLPQPSIPRDPLFTPNLSGQLLKLQQSGYVMAFRPPLGEEERNHYLSQIDAAFPKDYIALIMRTEGIKFANCAINGISEVRKITLLEGDYYVLAEGEEIDILAIKAGSEDRKIYQFDLEDNEQKSVGCFFDSAIVAALKDSYKTRSASPRKPG
jgi:hypothetical protein